jgi:quercetin dioxygenase-like cupin family protein
MFRWAPARAQIQETSVVKFPQDIVYKGSPGAPQHATLFGDSSQPGLYVDRIRFLPGMKVMPHWHPDTVRTVLVMSGTFYFAVGNQWDESKLKAYPTGTLYSEPPRTPHYAWAKDGEVILQITAICPTGNAPVSPKKPLRSRKAARRMIKGHQWAIRERRLPRHSPSRCALCLLCPS